MNLEKYTKENTPKFSLAGLTVDAKVIDVYDGDTITVAFETLGLGVFSHKIRLAEINTPEIRTRDADEKIAGYEARDVLIEKVMGKIVNLNILKYGKYGRLIGDITMVDGVNISDFMIAGGYAKKYGEK